LFGKTEKVCPDFPAFAPHDLARFLFVKGHVMSSLPS